MGVLITSACVASVLTQALVYYTGGAVPRASTLLCSSSISDVYNVPTDPRPHLAKVVVKRKSTHLIPSAPPSAQSVTHCLQV
ncbi:hypothetical protein J6590_083979 [Homalodisca vitripennis]|nr:hypothetical protein J6590_083979 [Homalodisca vitripennis]